MAAGKYTTAIPYVALCAGAAALWLYLRKGGNLIPNGNLAPNIESPTPENEHIWSVPYDTKPAGYQSLAGSKPWWNNNLQPTWTVPTLSIKPNGDFLQIGDPTTDIGRGGGCSWLPQKNPILAGTHTQPGIVIADARALYCLASLCHAGSISTLHLSKAYDSNPLTGDLDHFWGYAFDITDDQNANDLVQAAEALHMPIAWISLPDAKGSAPIWQLRRGIKTLIGHRNNIPNNHVHYTFFMPRPDSAIFVLHFK